MFRAQRFQHLAHAGEQDQLGVAGQEMVAIALRQPGIVDRVQRRHRIRQRILQPKPDHVGGRTIVRLRQAQITRGKLDALGDGRCGIHQGSVPIEHDQVKALPGHGSGCPRLSFCSFR